MDVSLCELVTATVWHSHERFGLNEFRSFLNKNNCLVLASEQSCGYGGATVTVANLPSHVHVKRQKKQLYPHLEVPCKIHDWTCKTIWAGQRRGWHSLSEGTGGQTNLLGGVLMTALYCLVSAWHLCFLLLKSLPLLPRRAGTTFPRISFALGR